MLKKKSQGVTSSHQVPPLAETAGRLSPKWNCATMDDVSKVIESAQRSENRFAEQQWTNEQNGKVYLLSCNTQSNGEPHWKFATGGLTGVIPKWEYETGDVSLIHSLVASEWGQSLEDLIEHKQPFVGTTNNGTSGRADSAPQLESLALAQDQVMLQGDLQLVQLPNLLQSIQMSNMSGRLALHNDYAGASMFFENGKLVHAENGASTGDAAAIEILGWQTGKFHFNTNERTSERTIKNQLHGLIMHGMTFADQSAYLEGKRLQLSSYLVRTKPGLKDSELEAILSKAAPIDMKMQKNFYWLVDDCTSLMELLRAYPLGEVDWVPIIFNLVTCDLIGISQNPAMSRQNVKLSSRSIDAYMLQSGIKGCLRPETGIFTFPSILYFAKQEYHRFEAGGSPFSLLVFNAYLAQGDRIINLPDMATRELLTRVQGLIRPFEMLGHFEALDFALLLPQTELKTAALVAQRIVFAIRAKHLFDHQEDEGNLRVSIGVAGIPDDGDCVEDLLGAAASAKKRSLEKGVPIVVFGTNIA